MDAAFCHAVSLLNVIFRLWNAHAVTLCAAVCVPILLYLCYCAWLENRQLRARAEWEELEMRAWARNSGAPSAS